MKVSSYHAPAHVVAPDVSRRLPRPRLLRSVAQALDSCGALWLAAPPGSGKTTLAAAHAGATRCALWLRADAGDADAASLHLHLREALAQACGEQAAAAMPAPTPPQAASPAHLLRHLARELFTALPAGALVVIDELQAIGDAEAIAATAQALIDERRAGQSLLLLSHEAPPVALSRALAAGRLAEFDARELAFDADETAAWLARCGAAAPSPGQAQALHQRSLGWPAAVALLMQPRGERRLQALIEDAIWPLIPPRAQAALQGTAWLPVLDGDDADPALLDDLAQRALLVERLVDVPPRWRVHGLLREFLQEREARELAPDAVAQRQVAAARRLGERGDADAALAAWCAAGRADPRCWPELDRWLCSIAPAWLAASRHAALRSAALAVPAPQRSAQLWLRLAQAESLRDPAAGRACADEALQRLPEGEVALRQQCHALAIASHFQAFDDTRPLAARVAALQALQDSPELHDAAPAQHATLAVAVWSALFLRDPAHPACAVWHERVRTLLHEDVDPNLKVRAAMLLAKQAWYLGRLADVRTLPEQARAELARPGAAPYARLLWGLLRQYGAWADGDWSAGRAATQDALAYAEDCGIHLLDQHLRLHGACFAALQGDGDAAQAQLDAVAARADASRRMEAWHHFSVRGWLALWRGDAVNADAALRVAVEAGQAMGPAPQAMALAARAHALQSLGEVAALRTARRELAALEAQGGNPLAAMHALLLDAHTALSMGDRDGALSRAGRALASARVQGLAAWFGAAPQSLAELLWLALDNDVETATATRIARSMRLAAPAGAGEAWPWAVKVHTLGRFEIEG
ncbi:hypothetical protein, partial [Variovorax sp. YR752]|uniref:hypothetical protein n=1 Tax=Variovorax sp. YR752 TaxID=1884383 RepID=UPI0031380B1B